MNIIICIDESLKTGKFPINEKIRTNSTINSKPDKQSIENLRRRSNKLLIGSDNLNLGGPCVIIIIFNILLY
jgi:hypothetical protein